MVNKYWAELWMEAKSGSTIYFQAIFVLISIILGFFGYWSFAAAVSLYFAQLTLFFAFSVYWAIAIQKADKLTIMLSIGTFLALMGAHFFFLNNILIYFFKLQLMQNIVVFVILLLSLLIKEWLFYRNLNEELLKYEINTDGSNIGFFRYLPIWAITAIAMFFNFTQINYYHSMILLIIFTLLVFFANILMDADQRLSYKEMEKNL